jgi:glutamate--cysteine ligase
MRILKQVESPLSQPHDSDSENEEIQNLIVDEDSLEGIFRQFEKPKSSFRIGVEHECFIVAGKDLKPEPWSGKTGMNVLLSKLAQHFSKATPITEMSQSIGILLDNASITLEPGCQLELSGAPLATINEIDAELCTYEQARESVLRELGLNALLMGFHPTALQRDFEWVPKQRYAIMRRYMQTTGSRGHDMMLRTCTVQGNFDYESEQDMIESFRLGLLASPIVTALFALSPFKEGKPSGFLSERTTVWHDTDNDRSGFPLEVFESNFSYRKWIKRVLDTPMYFVRRAGIYHDATHLTFRTFMRDGFGEFKACQRDFADHLTTIFTDARIKPQLELRGADCGPKSFLRALPAFWKGLLYDRAVRSKALAKLSGLNPKDLRNYQWQAAKEGLSAKIGKQELGALASDLLTLSKEGLENNEVKYLKPLEEVLSSGTMVAQKMLALYHRSQGSFDWLLDPLKSPFA